MANRTRLYGGGRAVRDNGRARAAERWCAYAASGRGGCVAYKDRGCSSGTFGGNEVVLSPDQRFLYVASGDSAVAGYRRDPGTGRLRPLRGSGGCITATAVDEIFGDEDPRAGRRCARSPLLGRFSDATVGLSISPDGRHLYVGSNTYSEMTPNNFTAHAALLVLQRNVHTGALRQVGCLTEAGEPPCQALRGIENALGALAVSPDGETVYVGASVAIGNSHASSVAVLDRDPVSGALTQLDGSAGCLAPPAYPGCDPARGLHDGTSALALSPDGRNLYLAGQDGYIDATYGTLAVFQRDPQSGALAQLQGEAGCLAGDGRDGCALGRHLGRYPENMPELAISPDGLNAYVVFQNAFGPLPSGLGVYHRDPSTGALTELPGRRGCLTARGRGGCTPARAIEEPESLTVSADGNNVYMSAFNSHAVAVFQRRPGTGALRQRPGDAGCTSGNEGPAIPGPLGGEFNVDEGCASGDIEGGDLELSRDGVYGYAPGAGRIAILARNAPRIRVRIRPRHCLTATTMAAVAIRAYARLRRVTVRLDGHVIGNTRRGRLRVRVPPSSFGPRRTLTVAAVDVRGRSSRARGSLHNCLG